MNCEINKCKSFSVNPFFNPRNSRNPRQTVKYRRGLRRLRGFSSGLSCTMEIFVFEIKTTL
jgi:hypothetical protein